MMIIAAKQLYAAFFRRDVASMLAALAEDVVWAEPTNPFNPADGGRQGHAGFRERRGIDNEAEEILAFEPRQLLGSEDSVAVVGFARCRARATGELCETALEQRFDQTSTTRQYGNGDWRRLKVTQKTVAMSRQWRRSAAGAPLKDRLSAIIHRVPLP